MKAYLDMWAGWSDFRGRTRRRDYWYATIVHFIVLFALLRILVHAVALGMPTIFVYVIQCACSVPGLAMAVRRLHDAGYPGHWMWVIVAPVFYVPLVMISPILGWLAMLATVLVTFGIAIVNLFWDSQREPNEWGPSPKYGPSIW